MKSLIFPLAFCIAVVTSAGLGAQEVASGSYWTGGGVTMRIDVIPTGTGSVAMQGVTSAGFSTDQATGSPGDHSTPNRPTCDQSHPGENGTMHVPVPTDPGEDPQAMAVSVQGGVACRWDGESWVPMRKVTRLRRGPNWGGSHGDFTVLQPGEVAPWSGFLWSTDRRRVVWLDAGDVAPWLGMLVPGDEVESLPT